MKIKFKELTRVTAYVGICPCTGESTQQIWEFDPGEIFEVAAVEYGPVQKIKTRPGKPGGRLRKARIVLKGGKYDLSDPDYPIRHPDYLENVLETDFDIIER